jgi:hypothetical protein
MVEKTLKSQHWTNDILGMWSLWWNDSAQECNDEILDEAFILESHVNWNILEYVYVVPINLE